MNEHAGLVTGMLDRMDRRMDEMGQMGGVRMGGMEMGMGIGEMGMSAEGRQAMIDQMQALRDDIRQLRVAAPTEIMERMPGHLGRLEEMARMMEQAAAYMRAMGGMGGDSITPWCSRWATASLAGAWPVRSL